MTNYLMPKLSDKLYDSGVNPRVSLILRADSYKFSHGSVYPENMQGMSSYGTARVSPKMTIIPLGMQLLIKNYLTQRITARDVQEAKEFAKAHFGRDDLFAEEDWLRVVSKYHGFLPLIIRAVPEGMPVRGQDPIYTVTVLDKQLAWMASYFETMIQRAIWYPTTIATMDFSIKTWLRGQYERTGADIGLLGFALHDFGARGVSSAETAEIGGFAHLVNFMGSDTVEGIVTAMRFYNADMPAYSVAATEHSIECSYGGSSEQESEYLRTVLTKLAKPGSIVSIVIDGYDVYRAAEKLCTEFRDMIIASGAKVVFRPDSGDMMEVVPRILYLQETAFGYTKTAKGYKKINNVGIIQGDGVDHLAIQGLIGKIVDVLGYSADNVVFGSGGALLQKVNRDTLKFAQKASAIMVDGKWVGISKSPITDPGKKSLEGVLTLVRSRMTGQLNIARLDLGEVNEEFEDVMKLVYYEGETFNETTLEMIRARTEGRWNPCWDL